MLQPDEAQNDIGKKLMEHRRALYSYIFACVRDSHLAEDLLQEVAQVAIESIDTLRDPEKFPNWLFGIARRRVLMHARRAYREQSVPDQVMELLAVAAQTIPPDGYLGRKDALERCLEELPANARGIIMQRYDGSVAGTDELALKIGRTVQATYGVLMRIRMKLLECVERKMAEASR